MIPVEFIKTYGKMLELMQEPAWVWTAHAVDHTDTETATFLWDPADLDSDVVLTREVEKEADETLISATTWSVDNAPTISGVVTNQTVNTEIALSGSTTLTITGTNYGAEDEDIQVIVYTQRGDTAYGPAPGNQRDGRLAVEATITAINGGDTQITATIELPAQHGQRVASVGACEVEVRNTKRFLKSAKFSGLSVAKQ